MRFLNWRTKDKIVKFLVKHLDSDSFQRHDEVHLQTYHMCLNHLCDECGVPGSPDFAGAVRWLKKYYNIKTAEERHAQYRK